MLNTTIKTDKVQRQLRLRRITAQFARKFFKSKSKLVSKSRQQSKWFWVWQMNSWLRLKKPRFMRRQKGNKRFSLFQQYNYRVHLTRFSKYDPRRSFIYIFTLRRPPLTRKERRFSNLMLRRYICSWYNIRSVNSLKTLYRKFISAYYVYFSFLHFLTYKLDSVLSVTRLSFNLPRSWDLIKLRVIFVNNLVAKTNNMILRAGDFISLSWLFFYCFRIPRKTYLFMGGRAKPRALSFLLVNYKILSFIFLGLPSRYIMGRIFNYSSLYKSYRGLPWFKQRYFSKFHHRGNFVFF